MSWDAYLVGDGVGWILEQSYTHNTNPMIERALGDAIASTPTAWWGKINPDSPLGRWSWWDMLDGRTGTDGAALLRAVLEKFDTEPATFRAMNPPNGWGDFDSLRDRLRHMADVSAECPDAVWQVSG